jgi:hypothetical protein
MSAYALNKLIREINRNPETRQRFLNDPASVAKDFELAAEEYKAVVTKDIGKLYRSGVHGLILRPFTLILQMSEPDYLAAIRS